MKTQWIIRSFVLVLPIALWTGCSRILAVAELPADVEFVVQNKSFFAQDADDLFARIVAGEPRDDLAGLDGCWGAFEAQSVDPTPPGDTPSLIAGLIPDTIASESYQVYSFDRGTNVVRWSLFVRDARAFASIVQVYEGVFSVNDNEVAFEFLRFGMNDLVTGEIMMEDSDHPIVSRRLVTLEADRLKLQPLNEAGGEIGPSDDLVFRRFVCP